MIKEELLKYHRDMLKFHEDRAVYFDAAESPQWANERIEREHNRKMTRFHGNVVKFLEGLSTCNFDVTEAK